MSGNNDSLIPETVPLHHATLQKFHSWRSKDIGGILNATRSFFEGVLDQVAETDSTDPETLKELVSVFDEFRTLQARQNRVQSNIDAAKAQYRSQSDALPPVTWENWDAYRDGTLHAPKLADVFSDIVRDSETTQDSDSSPTDELSLLFRALPHISANPQCMLPDELNDDDVQIEGGKIELSCPITCRPFENPMISRKCGHVFDKAGIDQYLSNATSRDCPQGACGQKVSAHDFQPDKLMMLRCKIATAREGSTKAKNAVESLVTV